MSNQAKVTERFNWIDENTLDYDFTVEDPQSWDQTWSARVPMRRSSDPVYEYACHEGNHGLLGILAGWRRYEVMASMAMVHPSRRPAQCQRLNKHRVARL